MSSGSSSALLSEFLAPRLQPQVLEWLLERCAQVSETGVGAGLFMAFGMVPRRLGKAPLAPTAAEIAAATRVRAGLDPRPWTVDQVGRMLLLLSLPSTDPGALQGALDRLCEDADLGELVAIYRALPLLPHPEVHRARAAEGVRSNMTGVLEAIALHNPYPAALLDEGAFNQVVLKCLFVGSPLQDIIGLDDRVCPTLAAALCDYACERWSAGRTVNAMMWRCVGPVAEGAMLDVLGRALEMGPDGQRLAVLLSVRDNAAADRLRALRPDLAQRVQNGDASWNEIAAGDTQ